MATSLKKTILLAALALQVAAQAQRVNYKITENDPDRKNLVVFINPFNVNAYFADINIGYNLQALYLVNNRLQAEAEFGKAYLDANTKGAFTPKNLKKAGEWRAGVVFNFSSKLKEVSNKVVLMSFSFGGYSYSRYTRVRAQARRTAGLRGGIQHFYNNYKISNDITEAPGKDDIRAKDKQGHLVYVRDTVTFETVSYIGKSTGLYAGLDLKTIRDLVIDTDEYGEKSNRTINNFYLDALFMPMVRYKLMPNDNQAYLSNADINISDNARRHLGWRLGWQHTINSTVGFNMKVEVGQQPGAINESYFLNLGLGLNVGLRAK